MLATFLPSQVQQHGVSSDHLAFLALLAEVLEARRANIALEGRIARVAGYGKIMRRERADWDEALADLAVPMHPAHIGAACRAVFPPESVPVANGGNVTIGAMFYDQVTVPNTVVFTFKFGMLGAGTSQPVAAVLARWRV